jgi:signal transduction histidine kinase
MAEGDRPSFTLHAASALRDQADRVTEHNAPKGTPRRRYLAQQRSKLVTRLVPTLALFAIVPGVNAAADLSFHAASVPRPAVVAEALVALVLGCAALAVPLARRKLETLVAVAAGAAVVAFFGWALVVHASGGAASPYLLILPLVLAVFTGLVPLPPRVTLFLGAVSYVALLLAAYDAPIAAHVFILAGVAAGWASSRTRHAQSLRQFLRVERLSAAVVRMRRVQEQLVVVEKLEALRVLVGGMAHEMNNAMTVSLASNQSALKLAEQGDTRGAMTAIQRSDGGLARIKRSVDRLRRFAMAAEGTLEPADVGAMLDFALESAIGRARSGVIIEREYDASVGAIDCHVAALAEALFQIARNAVEAMPGGGTIRAKVRSEGDRIVLAVQDEGRGIPADQLAKVFDPYWSRGAGARGDAGKAGLGLSAVYGLVNALGGSVEVQSRVGEGTEVAIRMPRKKSGK